jgi:glutamyl-Q tRNA(Asp) synthetase
MASYLDARASAGGWLVRMEDVDTTRVQAGAAADILEALERFGFQWDGEVVAQTARTDTYRAVFDLLREKRLVYPCGCTRKEIADSSIVNPAGQRYPGTCRDGLAPGKVARSWRVRIESGPISFTDRLQGKQTQDLEGVSGDFVILRADGVFAYQLAVVVDDRDQGITDVVRGADLLDSTFRQIYLQRLLGSSTPRYLHIPVAVNAVGQKLSKQTLAPAIGEGSRSETLVDALRFLGQGPPESLLRADIRSLWEWAIANWRPELLPRGETAPAPERFQ